MSDGSEHLSSPYGIGGFDFPITPYDRPALAASNLLLRGDLDATTRAMLAPQTLSPSQLTSFSKGLLGKNPNPILKTLVDVGTNPIFLLGMAATILYPATAVKPFAKLAAGLTAAKSKVGWLHGQVGAAFSILAHKSGWFPALQGMSRETTNILNKYNSTYSQIAKEMKGLKKWQRNVIGLKLDGADMPNKVMSKFFAMPKLAKGGVGNLDAHMTPQMKTATTNIRKLLDDMWSQVDEKTYAKMKSELTGKGVHIGKYRSSYLPHMSQWNNYMLSSLKDMSEGTVLVKGQIPNAKGYMKMLEEEISSGAGKAYRHRTGFTVHDWSVMDDLTKRGIVDKDYLPNLRAGIKRYVDEWSGNIERSLGAARVAGGSVDDMSQAFSKNMQTYISSHVKEFEFIDFGKWRLGGAKAMDNTLRRMGRQLVNIKEPSSLKDQIKRLGMVLGEPGTYAVDVHKIVPEYITSTSPTIVWWGKGYKNVFEGVEKGGKVVGGLIPQLAADTGDGQWVTNYAMNDLLPKMRGMKSWVGFNKSVAWGEKKNSFYRFLRDMPLVKKVLPTETYDNLLHLFSDARGSLNADSIGGKISHLFYLSTLGGNLSAPMKNSLQNWLTMMPLIGVKGLARGIPEMRRRIPQYMDDIAKGIGHEKAMFNAFPEYIKQMGKTEGILNAALAGDVMAESGLAGKVSQAGAGVYKKVTTGLMAPFSASEIFNRVFGFYAARSSFLAENVGDDVIKGLIKYSKGVGKGLTAMADEAANVFARDAVYAAHFPGGPMGIPRAIFNVNPALRQFMHFPMRYMDFLMNSVRLGADPAKLSLGVLGRAAAGSTALYYGAKNLAGVDLSPGLMTGAMPLPVYEKAPFHPFPLVPPLLSVAGNLGMAAFSGDKRRLADAASLVLPAGVSASRAYRSFSPKYADYKSKTPDGRIPVYNQSKSLIGSLTPWQLALRGMGLNPVNAQAEKGAAQWLLKQREQIREYRRNYLDAMMKNDHREADNINKAFQKRYPELGPIEVKKTDFSAIHNRREKSRVNRILKGFPKAYRPVMEEALTQQALHGITKDLPTQEYEFEQNFMENQ